MYKKLFQSINKVGSAEQGSTLVYGALILVAILAVSSLAIDGSNAYLQRREMQTAADAAALAGTHVLASGGSVNEVKAEARTVAELNDANLESIEVEAGNTVRVTVESTVQTYLAKVVDIDSLQARASAAAMFEPIPSIDGPPPLCVSLACVNQSQTGPITVIADEINSYCADSFEHYTGGPNSGLFLHSPEPDHPLGSSTSFSFTDDFREFSRVGDVGIFEEYGNGTARIVMDVRNQHDRGFKLDLSLSGRTSAPPSSSSPYLTTMTQHSDTNQWYYYSDWSGTLTGLSGTLYEGAEARIYGTGAAFQVGQGAAYYRGDIFGAAGWAWVYVTQQPNSGLKIFEDGWSPADVFFELNECDYLTLSDPSQPEEQMCNYRWLDFNGDMTSSNDIADYLNDPEASGLQTVGTWVAEGPWDSQVGAIGDALSNWAGKTIPVAVCGAGNDDNEYPIAGFTGFELASFDFSEFPKTITGQFEPVVVNSEPLNGAIIPDYLARDIRLVR